MGEITYTVRQRTASSGAEDIRTFVWQAEQPKACVQIAHGMAEHPARYDDFASFLAEAGYSVYMNEHAGHGELAQTLGYFPGEQGIFHVVDDMKALTEDIRAEHPDLPVYLMGHSMGSFLARDYITKYSQGLAGCILSGTAGPSPLYAVLNRLAKFIGKRKGERSEAAFISKVSGDTYLKRIEHPSGKWAWLSTVDEVCEKYDADPYSGFTFTNKGYEDLFALMVAIGRKDWPARVPKQLPLFIFSGSEDPVGDYGKGIVELAKRLREVDIDDVTVTLYPGGRHEMLNEANKDEVYSDVLAWLDGRV